MSDAGGAGDGAEDAAVLLMTLGEAEAADVLKHLGPKEVQRLGTAMAALRDVPRDRAEGVLDRFVMTVEDQTSLAVGTEDYIRSVLTSAFGASRANALLQRILTGDEAQGIEALKWMTPASIAAMVDGEHPQIVAIVLTCLDEEQAGAVMALLPRELQVDVLMRVANLDDVQQSALAEIEALLESRPETEETPRATKVGGDRSAADILNAMAGGTGSELLDAVNEADEELGGRIAEQMFVFESLLKLDDRGMQALLREIPNTDLAVALKGAEPALQDKFFNNMSKRAATLMREDMEAGGPVKLSEVEEAQKNIMTLARGLAEAGTISLGGGGDDYV